MYTCNDVHVNYSFPCSVITCTCTLDLSMVSPKIRSAYGEGTVVYNNRPRPQKFVCYF